MSCGFGLGCVYSKTTTNVPCKSHLDCQDTATPNIADSQNLQKLQRFSPPELRLRLPNAIHTTCHCTTLHRTALHRTALHYHGPLHAEHLRNEAMGSRRSVRPTCGFALTCCNCAGPALLPPTRGTFSWPTQSECVQMYTTAVSRCSGLPTSRWPVNREKNGTGKLALLFIVLIIINYSSPMPRLTMN